MARAAWQRGWRTRQACGQATRCASRRTRACGTAAGERGRNAVPIHDRMGCRRLSASTVKLDGGRVVEGAVISIGNPQFVIFAENEEFMVAGRAWQEAGEEICMHPDFPAQTNVEFVRRLARGPDRDSHLRARRRSDDLLRNRDVRECRDDDGSGEMRREAAGARAGRRASRWNGRSPSEELLLTGPASDSWRAASGLRMRPAVEPPADTIGRGCAGEQCRIRRRWSAASERLAALGYKVNADAACADPGMAVFCGDAGAAACGSARGVCRSGGRCGYLYPRRLRIELSARGAGSGFAAPQSKAVFWLQRPDASQTWLLDQAGCAGASRADGGGGFFARRRRGSVRAFAAALGGEAYRLGSEPDCARCAREARAGVLYGGCLSMLTASLGTPFAAADRRQAVVPGRCGDEAIPDRPHAAADDAGGQTRRREGRSSSARCWIAHRRVRRRAAGWVILRVLEWFEGPIAIGLRSGHVSHGNVTLPFGVEAELNSGRRSRSLRCWSRRVIEE